MESILGGVARLLSEAQRPLFITGAGISADSGLPTYRGVGGLYNAEDTDEGIPIEVALSGQMLRTRPEVAWKYLWQIGSACRRATFNRGHEVIAAIERQTPGTWVLTQNIDGYHRAAGSRNLIEIHGRADELFCLKCGRATTAEAVFPDVTGPMPKLPPWCADCGGLLRPRVVLFGEVLPEEEVRRLQEIVFEEPRDLVVVIGTTGVFPYIEWPVVNARQTGVPTVEINPAPSALSALIDHRLPGRAAPTLDRLFALMSQAKP